MAMLACTPIMKVGPLLSRQQSVVPGFAMMLPAERGLVVVITPCGIRDLRIGNELLPWESTAEISAEKCRGHEIIALRPTPGLQRQLCSIRNLARHAQNNRIVIRSEDLATDFHGLLRLSRLSQCCRHAAHRIAAGR